MLTRYKYLLIIDGLIFLAFFICAVALFQIYREQDWRTVAVLPEPKPIVSEESAPPAEESFVDKEYTLCFSGDHNLGTYTQDFHKGIDPYKYITPYLQDCDLHVGNLETNLSRPGVGIPQPKGYNFRAPLEAIDWMRNAGIDVMSLANNHTMDFGASALIEQMDLMSQGGIQWFGTGRNMDEAFTARFTLLDDLKIAFVGANDIETHITNVKTNSPGSAFFNQSRIVNAIKSAKANADLVFFVPHWGDENITRVNNRQRQWGKIVIDAGADAIVGASPHVRQINEEYKGKKIFYSLGNFATCGFYFVPEGSTGILLKMKVKNKQIISYEEKEIKISFLGLPKYPGTNPELYPYDQFKDTP